MTVTDGGSSVSRKLESRPLCFNPYSTQDGSLRASVVPVFMDKCYKTVSVHNMSGIFRPILSILCVSI